MTRYLIIILALSALGIVASAQAVPGVDIVLEPQQAQVNDVVFANVYIRNGVNIAGADIGITVDETCLQLEGLEPGTYMPDNGRSYTVYTEETSNSARLAATVLGQDNVVTGDGVFFRVPMRVQCDQQSTSISVAMAHLVDVGKNEFKSIDGVVQPVSALLAIGERASTTISEPETVLSDPMTDPATQVETADNNSMKIIVIVIAGILGLVFLGFALFGWRRLSNNTQ